MFQVYIVNQLYHLEGREGEGGGGGRWQRGGGGAGAGGGWRGEGS